MHCENGTLMRLLSLPASSSLCLILSADEEGRICCSFYGRAVLLPLMLAVFRLISTNWKVWLAKLHGFSWPAEWTTQEELVWRSVSFSVKHPSLYAIYSSFVCRPFLILLYVIFHLLFLEYKYKGYILPHILNKLEIVMFIKKKKSEAYLYVITIDWFIDWLIYTVI